MMHFQEAVSRWCVSKKQPPSHQNNTRGKEVARSYIWHVLDLGLGKEIGNWWNPTMKIWIIVPAMLPWGSNAQVIRMVLACKRISPMSWPLGILEWVNGSPVATHINFLHYLHYFRFFPAAAVTVSITSSVEERLEGGIGLSTFASPQISTWW